ncbi:MAG: RHS repeat-associated core domain-containing protein [Nocardioides sp.]
MPAPVVAGCTGTPTIELPPVVSGIAYSDDGRVTTLTEGSGRTLGFTYDNEGDLAQKTDTKNGFTATDVYAYDPSGLQLASKRTRADNWVNTTLYLGSTEVTIKKHSADPAQMTARRMFSDPSGSPVAWQTNDQWTWLTADLQGSVRLSLDTGPSTTPNTSIPVRHNYLPYGEAIGTTAPLERGYLGKPTDDNGDIRLDHRNYRASLGVFTTPDPLLDPFNPETLNPYSYVQGNPIGYSDPSGLCVAELCHPDPQDSPPPSNPPGYNTNPEFPSQSSSNNGAGGSDIELDFSYSGLAGGSGSGVPPGASPIGILASVAAGFVSGLGILGAASCSDAAPCVLAAADAASYSGGAISSGALVASGVAGGAAVSRLAPEIRAIVAAKNATNTALRVRPPLSIPKSQFGAKWGKHAADYGLDAGDAAARAGWLSKVRNVHMNPDEVRVGQYGVYDDAFMFRQGQDLLITRTDGTFVSMYPGANTSSWFKNAQVFDH